MVTIVEILEHLGGAMADEKTLWAWLHLSDIHFGHGSEPYQADQEDLISHIDADVIEVLKPGKVPVPQAILLTGDVGFRGGTTVGTDGKMEYDAAAEFINKLKKTLGELLKKPLPETPEAPETLPVYPEALPVYVVPGNHDVKRTSPTEETATKLLEKLRDAKSRPNLDSAVMDADNAKVLRDRFANYTKFCEGIGSPVGAGVDGMWVDKVSLDGAPSVHLIGLNTAFLCNDDLDHEVLNLPHKTTTQAVKNIQMGELVFVLTHHPTDWLNPRDAVHVTQKIRRYHCVHLHGHIHVPGIKQTTYGTGESVVTIAAGAVHADEGEYITGTPHTYSFGALVKLEDGSVVIRIWPRRWTPANARWSPDSEQLPPTENYVQYVLIRPVAKVPETGIEYISDLTEEILKALPSWEKDRYSKIVVPIRSSPFLDAEPKQISPDFELVENYRDNFTNLSDQLASLIEDNGDPGEAADVSSQLRLLLEGVYQQRLTFDGENRDATGSAVTPEEVFGELLVMPTATQIQVSPRAVADVDQKFNKVNLDASTTGSDGYIG
jgi:hypothetical protein